MKLLLVDYLAPVGHIGFNSYHIDKLHQICDDITFVSQKKHIDDCGIKDVKTISFPDKFFKKYKGVPRSVYNRIQDIQKLLFLKRLIRKKKYDKIIFLSYDIMASGIIKFEEECLLINHANVDGLKYKIKYYLTKYLPFNYKLITLSDYIQQHVQKIFPYKEILVVPHGLTKEYKRKDSFISPFGIEKFIYCPTTSSCDEVFLMSIIKDGRIQDYLSENNIVLIIKSKIIKETYPNIKIVTSYIDMHTYSNLMNGAIAVFAPYSKSFLYRISAVLMECIGNNIPIISTHSMCFDYFKKYANYNMVVDSPKEFLKTLIDIQNYNNKQYYFNIQELDALPYWKKILLQ